MHSISCGWKSLGLRPALSIRRGGGEYSLLSDNTTTLLTSHTHTHTNLLTHTHTGSPHLPGDRCWGNCVTPTLNIQLKMRECTDYMWCMRVCVCVCVCVREEKGAEHIATSKSPTCPIHLLSSGHTMTVNFLTLSLNLRHTQSNDI